MKIDEFIQIFKLSELSVKGGAFNIWGTSFGKIGDNFYKITRVDFDADLKILYFDTDYVKAKIWNPKGIEEKPSKNDFWPPSIEIKKADRIKLEYTFKNVDYYIDFDFETKNIESNSDMYTGGQIEDSNKEAMIFA